MMEKTDIVKASGYTSPDHVTVVCTTKPDGTPNLAAVSWFTYLSFNPPTVGFAMSQGSFTGETFRGTKEAVITFPGSAIADGVMECGMSSGRDTDKSGNLELTGMPGTDIRIPAETRVAMRVSLERHIETGDHYFYVCRVEDVMVDESKPGLFAWDGYSRLAPARSE